MNEYAVFENGNIATIEKVGKGVFEVSITSIRGGTGSAQLSTDALLEFIDAVNQVLDSDIIDAYAELADKNLKDKTAARKRLGIKI